MTARIDYAKVSPQILRPLLALNVPIETSGLEPALIRLVQMRASQINGCAFCLDMHSKDARAAGEKEQRLYLLEAWRETSIYSDRERAALGWTEAVTRVTEGHVPDDVYAEVAEQFDEQELAALTLAVVAINSFNRLNVAFRIEGGSYQPGMFKNLLKTA
jgi:AhpD family alkylhydroperoxidase